MTIAQNAIQIERIKENIMSKFIGTRKFYRYILIVAIPIMVQNGITNFVSLLDNIMVGKVGTDQMNGVAIVNQLIFVFNLAIFGGLSGAGIFGTQFYGKKDYDGVRHTFRFKILIAIVLLAITYLIFIVKGDFLIEQFLHQGSETGNILATKNCAKEYLLIMLLGLIPFAWNQCYVSTLRECGETFIPMVAGIIAVFVNLVLNYILIFGKFGAPELGANGAAIATVLSRFVESAIIIIWTHLHTKENPYIIGLYRSFTIPLSLTTDILLRGCPLLINEILWSASITLLNQRYSTRGLAAVAAVNITSTINNVFNVVFIAIGSSIAIVVGQLLGAGKMEEARDTDNKMIAFTVAVCFVMGTFMAFTCGLFPQLYNTTAEVKSIASKCILIMAILMPFCAFNHASYFTLRSGGQTIIAFLFDSLFMVLVSVPIATILAKGTSISILWLYGICQSLEVLKCIMGYIFVKRGDWIRNIVNEE